MGAVYFPGAVDRSRVETFGLVDGVLDLEAGFDVLDRCGDERDGPAGHYACDCVAEDREFCRGLLGREFKFADVVWGEGEDGGVGEEVLVQNAAVECEGAEHPIHIIISVMRNRRRQKQIYTESINIHPTSGGVAPL